MENKICPKCGGEMERGTYSGNQVDWQQDKERSFLRSSGKEIISYACNKCGYMENYVKK